MTTATGPTQPTAGHSAAAIRQPARLLIQRVRPALAALRTVLILIVVCVGVSLLLVSDPPFAVLAVWGGAVIAAAVCLGAEPAREAPSADSPSA